MILLPQQYDLFDQLFDALYVLDNQGKIVFWNKAAEETTGYTRGEVTGHLCSDNILIHLNEQGELLCGDKCPMRAAREFGQLLQAEVYLKHKNGHRLPVTVRAVPLHDADGRSIGSVEIFTDRSHIAAERARIAELERLALIDELTGLPNRRFLNQQLEAKLAEKTRMGITFGVLMMDIDHFKKVNDAFGHDAGDHVLKTIANTLKSALRPYDFLGRWGGEEFLALISFADENLMRTLAERFRFLTQESHPSWNGRTLTVTISVGGALAASADTLETLVKLADDHLYKSKNSGRNRVSVAER